MSDTEDLDNDVHIVRKKHLQRFTDSESDDEEVMINDNSINLQLGVDDIKLCNNDHAGDSQDDKPSINIQPRKSRIRKISTSNSSNTDSHDEYNNEISSKSKSSRIKSKKNKLKDKFESLVLKKTMKVKSTVSDDGFSENADINEKSNNLSDISDSEATSVNKIRAKIKEKIMEIRTSICDPDTSDEDSNQHNQMQKNKKERKYTKLTSPKPIRISAKQAMENMQKIKSESNRMLREKEVSLPYHRPKALSLKDIMSRRRPALTSDGKAMPIKMNEEQLRQYALQLEQRQKEMMELCKSDTEDEEDISCNEKNTEEVCCNNENINDTSYDDLIRANEEVAQENLSPNGAQNEQTEGTANVNMTKMLLTVVGNENNVSCINENIKEISDSERTLIAVNSEKIEGSHFNAADLPNNLGLLEYSSKEDQVTENLIGNTSSKLEQINKNSEENDDTDPIKHKDISKSVNRNSKNSVSQNVKAGTESDSQLISLMYDSEKLEDTEIITEPRITEEPDHSMQRDENNEKDNNDFSDDDINLADIDNIIENAEIFTTDVTSQENVNFPMIVKEPQPLKTMPKLTGAPGMVIDLDGSDSFTPKKLTGVALLKERFTYFAKLKTPEELERDREKKIKPGMQHLQLKQELEEKIAEQRSLEWAKRLEEEQQQRMEVDTVTGQAIDAEDDIDKIEAKLEENNEESSSESEEEEDDIVIKDKPRVRNPMIADEAEESECDEYNDRVNDNTSNESSDNNDDDDESDKESSEEESEQEEQAKPKKGRIIKAFEDSDDEVIVGSKVNPNENIDIDNSNLIPNLKVTGTDELIVKDTQDDELQLAQRHKSFSDDLFTSQESTLAGPKENDATTNKTISNEDLGTQTFSIINTNATKEDVLLNLPDLGNLNGLADTQNFEEGNLDDVVAMCSGTFTQNLVTSQFPVTQQVTQDIGEDVLALCTGKFYENQFISQVDDGEFDQRTPKDNSVCNDHMNSKNILMSEINSTDDVNKEENANSKNIEATEKISSDTFTNVNKLNIVCDVASNEPHVQNKKLVSDYNQNKENKPNIANTQAKKKFIIDSDDEGTVDDALKKKKRFKKKKLKERALQISDDEEEETWEQADEEEFESEIEDNTERIIEYDSEENEVEFKAQIPKKKNKTTDFFEQEAELTSEDEWVGSGDEDEAGLDRMEREAGDDDVFHQGRLQRELEQIHMRDVLDQDKREVRIIQELLFEDGDLGGGHRQRKFRWRNAGGDDETETTYNEFTDTQEEEFESEEQWRKQRHEREMFLKQMQKQDEPEESLNISVNRTSIIKANLCSKTMSSLLMEVSTNCANTTSNVESPVVEKKSNKDIPSPVKPFAIFQQYYHGSLLTRGRGALARLAALATPLAVDDDAPKASSVAPSSNRNFVFAALTPDADKPKGTKRRVEGNIGTPKLVKKMKMEEKRNYPKSSLLDHLKA